MHVPLDRALESLTFGDRGHINSVTVRKDIRLDLASKCMEVKERMKKAILATKVGMTQIFSEDGTLTPVTVLQAGPCAVTQVKTVENPPLRWSQLPSWSEAVQGRSPEIRSSLLSR